MKRSKKIQPREGEKTTWIKHFFIAVGFLVLIAAGGIIVSLLSLRGVGHDVELELIPETNSVSRGIPFEISIDINNQTSGSIYNAELIVNLGPTLVSLELDGDRNIIKELVGDIRGGGLTKHNFTVLPIAKVGSSEQVTAILSYSIGKTKFEKRTTEEIKIDKEPFTIEIERPGQILAGSTFEINLVYENNSEFDFNNLSLEVNYPTPFNFTSSDLTPDSLNNHWELGALKEGTSGELKIRGMLESVGGESTMEAVLSTEFLGRSYVIAVQETDLIASDSPIGLKILIGRNDQYIARIGEMLRYNVIYSNKSGVALKDVEIEVEIFGELFDFETLQTDAEVNSQTHTLRWDKNTTPSLKLLEPGEKGVVEVAINLKKDFPIERLNDKNFSLGVSAHIESPSVPYYLEAEKTSASIRLQTKVAGMVSINTKAFYRDASSGILNTGALPPKVDLPTQYTVHWIIKNYSTDLDDVSIRAIMSEGSRWTGAVKSNVDSVPLFDEKSKEISWDIDSIIATKGIINAPIEAIFQIEAVPTLNMVGKFQPLLGETTLTAKDEFTSLLLQDSALPLNTSLPEDYTVGVAGGVVIQ